VATSLLIEVLLGYNGDVGLRLVLFLKGDIDVTLRPKRLIGGALDVSAKRCTIQI
jgi:hypothetical protein